MNRKSISVLCAAGLVCALSALTSIQVNAAPGPRREEHVPEGVERIVYRDWPDSYRLFTDACQAVVVPRVGARLSELSFESRNMLLQDHTIDGFDVTMGAHASRGEGREWIMWDGCQSDMFNGEGTNQLEDLWVSPYAVTEVGPRTVTLTSKTSAAHKAHATKRFRLHEKRPALTYEYTVTNDAKEPRKWACYHRIMYRTPAFVVARLKPDSAFQGGYQITAYGSNQERRKQLAQACIQVREHMAVIAPHRLSASPEQEGRRVSPQGTWMLLSSLNGQVSSDSDAGWVAVLWGDCAQVITYEVDRDEKYLNNCTLSVYWEPLKLVLEPRGAYVTLKPGESAQCNTTWSFVKLSREVRTADHVWAVLDEIKSAASGGR